MVTTRPPKTIVKPTALGPVANTDTKSLIYGLFQKGRVLAQDGVRFCRHPSRPRVEWPDLPGRGNRQRLSVRWQNLSVPHRHHKANHRHPLVRTTLFRSDAQAQGLGLRNSVGSSQRF